MKVGDYVIAQVPLWTAKRPEQAPRYSEGYVIRAWDHDVDGLLVDVETSHGIAKGCVPGRHVVLHPASGTPLIEALK